MSKPNRQLDLFEEVKAPRSKPGPVSTRVDTLGILGAAPSTFAWEHLESESGAWLVDDLHRLLLWRSWSAEPRALFVMLNPSRGDAVVDDPTLKRCIGFAKAWGCGGINVVNLYSLIETNPDLLWQTEPQLRMAPVASLRPAAESHADVYRQIVQRTSGPLVVAWGGIPPRAQDRVDELAGVFLSCKRAAFCLGTTRQGQPRHPLYVPGATQLMPILGRLVP